MLEVEVNIKNSNNRDISFNKEIYRKQSSKTRNKNFAEFKKLKDFDFLEVNIKGFEYDDIKGLSEEELKIIAEHEGIENYWTKGKQTLINDLTTKDKEEE